MTEPVGQNEQSSPETAELVLEYLCDRASNGLVTASNRKIADDLEIGRTTAARAIARLLTDEKVIVDRLGTGHLYPTRYRLVT